MGGTEGAPELRLASGIEVMTRGDVQSTEIVPGETVHAWVFDARNGEALYNAVGLTAQAGGALSGMRSTSGHCTDALPRGPWPLPEPPSRRRESDLRWLSTRAGEVMPMCSPICCMRL